MAVGRGHAIPSNLRPLRTSPPSGSNRDQLFYALDGRYVKIGGVRHRLEIYSVCDHHGHRWVQLALIGESSYMLTLKVAARGWVEDVLFALECGTRVSSATFATGATSVH